MAIDVNNKLQLKQQGVRSNTKGVQRALRQHILDRYEDYSDYEGAKSPVDALRSDVEAATNPHSPQGAKNLVADGGFELYYEPVKEFIESLGLRKSKPEYNDQETWDLYVNLMAREIKNLISNPKLAEKLMKPIVPAAKPQPQGQAPAQPAQAPLPPLDQIKK